MPKHTKTTYGAKPKLRYDMIELRKAEKKKKRKKIWKWNNPHQHRPRRVINPVIAEWIRRTVKERELLKKVGKASDPQNTWQMVDLNPLGGTMPTSKKGLRTTL